MLQPRELWRRKRVCWPTRAKALEKTVDFKTSPFPFWNRPHVECVLKPWKDLGAGACFTWLGQYLPNWAGGGGGG